MLSVGRALFQFLVIVLLLHGAAVASAQTCEPPIAAPQISAPPQVCPYTAAIATVQPPAAGTWQAVSWNIQNGHFVDANGDPMDYANGETVQFVANSSNPVTLSAHGQDSSGCESPEGTAEVAIRTIAAPQLSVPEQVCPYTPAIATIQPPAEGTWQAVSWSIQNGHFLDANGNPVPYANGETIQFAANSTAPVTLFARGQDSFGCESPEGAAEVPIRTIAAPQLSVPEQVCPYTPAIATIQPPAEGTWQAVSWSIQNGHFVDANGNPVPYANGETIQFAANSTAPVTLSARAQDSFGCESPEGTAEVAIRTIAAPQLSVPEQVCPYTPAIATIQPPAEGTWQAVSWSIQNGHFVDANGNPVPYANGETIRFAANSNAPVTLSARAQDSFGCESPEGTAEVAIRTTAAPQLSVPEQVCPYTPAIATIQPPAEGTWQAVSWSIQNGHFVDANGNPTPYANGETIRFAANSNAPVTLSARAQDSFGCESPEGTAEVAIRTTAAPQLSVPEQVCPYAPAIATIQLPAEGTWQHVSWSILNGHFLDANGNPMPYANGETVQFAANSNAPVTLSARGEDSFGCQSPEGTAEVPIRTIPSPQILAPAEVCWGAPATASILPPDEGTWQSVSWSIQNGHFVDANGDPQPGANGEEVRFVANSANPVTLFASAQDSLGCDALQGTITIPTVAGGGAIPSIALSSPDICGTELVTASVVDEFTSYDWTVVNGTIAAGDGTHEITFVANGAGPVTVTVETSSGSCPRTDSETLPLTGPPSYLFAPPTACVGGVLKAHVPDWYSSFSWSAVNATIEGPVDADDVSFRATGTGPVILSFLGIDANGCFTRNSATIPTDGYPTPQIQFPQGESLCPGGSSAAQADDFYPSYEWIVTNATNVSGQGTPFVTFTHIPGAGDVGVVLSVGEGECVGYAARSLPIRSTTPLAAELASPSVCANGDGTLYVDNYDSYSHVSLYATNGTILGNGPGRVPGGRTITFRNNGAGDTTILVQADSNSCLMTEELTAAMVALPAATIAAGGPTTFCAGGSVTLTASAGASYLWSTGATTQSIVVATSGSYGVTVTNANGCSATSAATNVTVYPGLEVPVITPGGPTTFCQGGSVTLTAPASASYLWSNGATTQSIVVNASGAYSVTVTDGNGCSATSAATNVTVHPMPAVPVITPSGSTNLCPGQNVTLTAPAGFTYLWSNGATTQSITVSTAGGHSVTVTNANGCQRTSAAVNVTANPPTVITTHPLTQTMPRNTTRVLTVVATGTATLQYQWYTGFSGNTSTPIAGATNASLTIGPVSKKGTLRYWVRVTSTGCPGSTANSNTAVITVN